MSQQRLVKLRMRESQVKTQIHKLESRIKSQQSRDDTRRKILVGAALLSAVEVGEVSKDFLVSLIDKKITRENDRALLNIFWVENNGE